MFSRVLGVWWSRNGVLRGSGVGGFRGLGFRDLGGFWGVLGGWEVGGGGGGGLRGSGLRTPNPKKPS